MKPLLVTLLMILLVSHGESFAAEIDFAHDIAPVLKQKCGKCHTGTSRKGSFSLNTRLELLAGGETGKAVIPGDAGKSHLVELISSKDDDIRMPPEGDPLTAKQITLIKTWIDSGANWEPGFSFSKSAYEPPLKPRHVTLPTALSGRNHPIDRIIDAYLSKHKTPSPKPLSDEDFLRRVSLDIIGLLPTLEQRSAFLADTSPNKRKQLIATLLADDIGYADHWLTFWNDLLRNDYTGTGFITRGRTQITTWLYDSLLTNKPYDQFVRELISPVSGAEGFIQGIRWRGEVNASQTVEIQFSQNISQVFLGINMKCASCHDSFIDRWKLEEAYQLAAIFSTTPLELHRCDKPTGKMANAAWIFPELGDIDPKASQPERLKQLAALMTAPENGRFSRTIVNRVWHRLMGHGIVHPVDAMHTEPWNEDLLDYLANSFVKNGYDLRKLISEIVTSQAYQSKSVILKEEPRAGYRYAGPLAKRMTAEQFMDAVWQITGAGPTKMDAAITRKPTGNFSSQQAGNMIRASLVKNDFLMRSLGRPHREQVVTTRPNELTTLQAIDLSNGNELAQTLKRGAVNILKTKPNETTEFAKQLTISVLTREPTSEELEFMTAALGEKPAPETIEDLLWSLIMLPEFQLIR